MLGTFTDPRLPANALDLILMVDVYHEFGEPQEMLRRMREALKDTLIMLVPMLLVLALLIVWPQVALFVPSLVSPEFLR